MEFNASSTQQLCQLLFAPYNKKGKKPTEEELASEGYEWDYPRERAFRVENESGFIKEGNSKPLKFRDMIITGMGLAPLSFTAGGMAQVDAIVVRKLAGKDPSKGQYGLAYEHFLEKGQPEFGIEMCIALDHWLAFKGIEKLLSTYINPLQEQPD